MDMQRATKSPEIRYFAQSLWAVPVAPAIDYTDALQKQITYERLRSSLLHCTHDGLERQSRFVLMRQQVTSGRNGV
jgi:hypothetical protein